jgi:hypothetical protein
MSVKWTLIDITRGNEPETGISSSKVERSRPWEVGLPLIQIQLETSSNLEVQPTHQL